MKAYCSLMSYKLFNCMDKTLKHLLDVNLTVTVTEMFLTTTILYTKLKVGKFSTLTFFSSSLAFTR
jgi:hypothetical protein